MIGIYKITSPTNKVYIGQSVNIEKRILSYKNERCKSQPRLLRSIKKHGWDKHKFEILCQCLENELNGLEKYYIDLYQTFNNENGLNIRDGGGSKGRVGEITKVKISNYMKGEGNPFYGKKHSQESLNKMRGRKLSAENIIKMSEHRKGKPSGTKGRKCTETHKKNISEGRKRAKITVWNKGKKRPKFSDEWLEKMRVSHLGKTPTEEHKKSQRAGLLNYWKNRKEREQSNCI
jgi:group I intron endonuclease